MATTPIATAEIAESLGLTERELLQRALESLLQDKKREALQHRLDILARYAASSVPDLESKIAQGDVPEHPAWEDLIVAENLAARLEELDAYLDHLRGAEGSRSE